MHLAASRASSTVLAALVLQPGCCIPIAGVQHSSSMACSSYAMYSYVVVCNPALTMPDSVQRSQHESLGLSIVSLMLQFNAVSHENICRAAVLLDLP
jgi:hypothetical protein